MLRFSHDVQLIEIEEWQKYYTPPPSVAKDDLILDVGAREGDSALFYALSGYRNLRLVEPNPMYFNNLIHNVASLNKFGIEIDLRLHPFRPDEQLPGVKFIKFDCEGCESEIDLDKLTVPWVAEMHELKPAKGERHIYDYAAVTGYRKGAG